MKLTGLQLIGVVIIAIIVGSGFALGQLYGYQEQERLEKEQDQTELQNAKIDYFVEQAKLQYREEQLYVNRTYETNYSTEEIEIEKTPNVLNYHSWTRAVCDYKRNVCIEMYIECIGDEMINMTYLSGEIFMGWEWEDPRPEEFKNKWCQY